MNHAVRSPTPLALDTVLGQCAVAQVLVENSLLDLSSIPMLLMDDSDGTGRRAAGNIALEKAGAIETRLKEACQTLAIASRALTVEIKERRMLDHQFAAMQEQEATGRHRMLHDALTGMPNRILFKDRLEHELAQSRRHGRPLAVAFIDLDGFKQVNDRHGHDMGDSVLRMIATRILSNTRTGDTTSRFGGDEFMYLFSDPGDQKSIISIVQRMIRLIQEPCQVSSHGTEISISLDASIGISISPKNGVTVDLLIKSADSAMYLAKQQKTGYSFAP